MENYNVTLIWFKPTRHIETHKIKAENVEDALYSAGHSLLKIHETSVIDYQEIKMFFYLSKEKKENDS